MSDGDVQEIVQAAYNQARYDELAENIHIYYHLDATIDRDIKEFEELHFLLFGTDGSPVPDQAGSEVSPRRGKDAA